MRMDLLISVSTSIKPFISTQLYVIISPGGSCLSYQEPASNGQPGIHAYNRVSRYWRQHYKMTGTKSKIYGRTRADRWIAEIK